MSDDFVVNGLPLPMLLISLLQEDKWRYPGPTAMNEVIPYEVGPIDLPIRFYSLEMIRFETAQHLRMFEYPQTSDIFHLYCGSAASERPIELPWLDIEKSLFIAGSEVIGDDIEIALDYRMNHDDPRVVAPAWRSEGCLWTEVTPTFTEFVERLGLK